MNFFELCTDLFLSLREIALNVINWFTTDINIPLIDLSVQPIELLFGGGLIAFLGVLIIKTIL